jgi:hypothetical protein
LKDYLYSGDAVNVVHYLSPWEWQSFMVNLADKQCRGGETPQRALILVSP